MAPGPCPRCETEKPRVFGEASRYGDVWYCRCQACGHVWSVGKLDNAIHHVTPLQADGSGRPADALDSEGTRVSIGFLRTELHAGITFAALAADAEDAEKRRRRRLNAVTAYDAVIRFLPRARLTDDEVAELRSGIDRLRHAIEDIPA